jgi:GT2 family glycosyltransferase
MTDGTVRWIAGARTAPAGTYDADIVILALDRMEETLAAIGSALAQTGVSAHVFVLDQGSRHDTLRRLAAAVQGQPRATLVAAARNLGVAGGRNAASALGHGRIIVALDNDAEFAAADSVARMAAALDAEPNLAALGCRIVRYSDGRDDALSWGYPPALRPCAADCFDAVTFVGAGHAIRRSAWEAVGGYDPALFFCWEEFDFCRRAIAAGWRIRYRGDLEIRHKVSAERRIAWSSDRWYHFVRNRLYIERKFGAGWPSLAPRILGYLLKSLRHGLAGQTVGAVLAAARMAPARMTSTRPVATEPPAARLYLLRNDRLHRGSWLARFRYEVLGRLAAAPPAGE